MSGVASIRCVRPIFTTSATAFDLASRVARSFATAGSNASWICTAAATCMTVGKTSFELCDLLTSSLGWMGFFEPRTPPASSMARLPMTSFAFMFDWVPLPVCQTTSGKWSSSFPAMTSSQARTMSDTLASSSLPSSRLVIAPAFFTMPKARMTSRVKRWPPILKFSSDLCVCAPQ